MMFAMYDIGEFTAELVGEGLMSDVIYTCKPVLLFMVSVAPFANLQKGLALRPDCMPRLSHDLHACFEVSEEAIV